MEKSINHYAEPNSKCASNKKFYKLAEKTTPPIAMLLEVVYTYLVKMVSS